MRLAFVTFLMLAFYGSTDCFGQPPTYTVPRWYTPQVYAPSVYAPPPTIYVPQVQMVPYQLERTEVIPREYATPLRDLLFGRWRMQHVYKIGTTASDYSPTPLNTNP